MTTTAQDFDRAVLDYFDTHPEDTGADMLRTLYPEYPLDALLESVRRLVRDDYLNIVNYTTRRSPRARADRLLANYRKSVKGAGLTGKVALAQSIADENRDLSAKVLALEDRLNKLRETERTYTIGLDGKGVRRRIFEEYED